MTVMLTLIDFFALHIKIFITFDSGVVDGIRIEHVGIGLISKVIYVG
jgi:hypothetical protein